MAGKPTISAGKTPLRGSYSSHRERQRRRILDAAEKLFDERGIERVTIADVVNTAGIRTSTLYEYFSNKDEIIWAIVERVFTDAAARAKQSLAAADTALAKISALFEFMADGLANDTARVRFMAQFDAAYARRWPASRLLSLEAKISPGGFEYFGALIRDGMREGTLRSDLNPDLTMHALINAVIGAQRRLASLGSRVESEYGQPVDRLFGETLRILLLGLRATDLPSTKRRVRRQPDRKRKRLS